MLLDTQSLSQVSALNDFYADKRDGEEFSILKAIAALVFFIGCLILGGFATEWYHKRFNGDYASNASLGTYLVVGIIIFFVAAFALRQLIFAFR